MFRLAHFSDVHLGPLPNPSLRQLASKRLIGYVNWHADRRKRHQDDISSRILAAILAAEPTHVALTGDLINLGLQDEVDTALAWLKSVGGPDFVSVVPGNHDAYVPGAFARAYAAWQPYMQGDKPNSAGTPFPYLRVRGKVALIGISSARATAPFMATGYFRKPQARETERMLAEAGKQGLYRIVMIHHPPIAGGSFHRRLVGARLFRHIVRKYGAELVLHGHTHLSTLHWLPGEGGLVPVVGVAAAGQAAGGIKPAAQYNVFEISGEPRRWSTSLTRFGLGTNPGESVVLARTELSTSPP